MYMTEKGISDRIIFNNFLIFKIENDIKISSIHAGNKMQEFSDHMTPKWLQ